MNPSAALPAQSAGLGNPLHHGSHRNLIAEVDYDGPNTKTVQAIIVPTGRKPDFLDTAIDLAAQLGTTLVALCSLDASVSKSVERAAQVGVELVAVDMAAVPAGILPEFETSALLDNTPFQRGTDTSAKRNLGLLLANVTGWERIVFLDDDIWVPRSEDLNDAVGLLDRYAGVGLRVGGFPDNSVVCHAHRTTGGFQESFIGGGALVVSAQLLTSFFPDIYNEDWFFLLDHAGLRPTARVGEVKQNPYDPYRVARARSEELGDTLAEGIFWLLDAGRHLPDATVAHWTDFLEKRRQLIHGIIGRTKARATPETSDLSARMVAALTAALDSSMSITPQLCVDYLDAWRSDSRRWAAHVADQEAKLAGLDRDLDLALKSLDLTGCATHVPKR